MHIVIFAAVDFPAGPATTSRVKHIAKILLLAGNEVTVACLQANAKVPHPENNRKQGEFEGIRFIYLSGNTVRPSGLASGLLDIAKGSLGAVSLLRDLKRQNRVDLVLFYTPDLISILPALALAKRCSIPVVLELCEVNSTRQVDNYKQRIRRLTSRWTESVLPRFCTGVVVISKRITELLVAYGVAPQKIFHLPILVDCGEFGVSRQVPLPWLIGKRYFLNSGALGEKDGVNYLLEALALVLREHQDIFMVFTGEPDPQRKQQVMGLARHMGVEERILFTGFLPQDQLVWAYHHALGLLCCRNNSPYANFGSPTKLCEYLSTGRPVITNAVGDTALYLDQDVHAFFARAEDCRSIAQQMCRILAEPELANRVGKAGQEVARKHFDYVNYVSPLDAFVKARCGSALGVAAAPKTDGTGGRI